MKRRVIHTSPLRVRAGVRRLASAAALTSILGAAAVARADLTYIDDPGRLSPADRTRLGNIYDEVWTDEMLGKLLRPSQGVNDAGMHDWADAERTYFLQELVHFQQRHDQGLPQTLKFSYLIDDKLCWNGRDIDPICGGAAAGPNAAWKEHLSRARLAFFVFLDANNVVDWSILDYDKLVLRDMATPFGTPEAYDIDITENYNLLTGNLSTPEADSYYYPEAGGSLAGQPVLVPSWDYRRNAARVAAFLHQRVWHVKDFDDSKMPHRKRDANGNPIDGHYLDRGPTPKEVLLQRDPHRVVNAANQALYFVQERGHLIKGCYGGARLAKALFTSIGLSAQVSALPEDGGGAPDIPHKAFSFTAPDGAVFHVGHADNLYNNPFVQSALRTWSELSPIEDWFDNARPANFRSHPDHDLGHSIFVEADSLQATRFSAVMPPGLNAGDGESFQYYGGNFTNNLHDTGFTRVQALRSLAAVEDDMAGPLDLFTRCAASPVVWQNIPFGGLTPDEEEHYGAALDDALATSHGDARTTRCSSPVFPELAQMYFLRTGVTLTGDADGDGIPNAQDPRAYEANVADVVTPAHFLHVFSSNWQSRIEHFNAKAWSLQGCGNGLLEGGEACDDGDAMDPTCRIDCTEPPPQQGQCGGGNCGHSAVGCYCDEFCVDYGDCCADYATACSGDTRCPSGQILDCTLSCADPAALADGVCGMTSDANFETCPHFDQEAGECGQHTCPGEGEVRDCDGVCHLVAWIGDTTCDDGEAGEANFACNLFQNDAGTCPGA
ncbi:MAG: hypothetical protein R3B09_09585 [Nannocystaceae bacterium]